MMTMTKHELEREKMRDASERAERRLTLLFLRAQRALERCSANTPVGDSEGELVDQQQKQLQRSFGRLASALSQRDKERFQLLARSIHDLKSPLMVAAGAARQLRHKDISEEEREEWLDLVVRNVTNMEFLVVDLLKEARQEAQRSTRWDAVNLSELARTVVRDYDATPNNHALHFAEDEASDCTVMGDRESLQRLVSNLLSNAVKSSSAGRDVCVSVWRRANGVLLGVEDDGHGDPISSTERMFLPFTRLDESHPDNDSAEIAHIKCIAQIHGADICVQGTPGYGTAFQICFPVPH
ncbi:HAMP domain-containing histidine kinase [bacterium]|nr:MAG: HAMP domain-containing histidine kinase [bacterium]